MLVAFLFRAWSEAPFSVLRYLPPALAFVAFNIYSGTYQPGIDNAAHVGGLLAGLGMGAFMARPLERRKGIPFIQTFAGILFAGVYATSCLSYLDALITPLPRLTGSFNPTAGT